MKKLILLFPLILIASLLAGCTAGDDSSEPFTPQNYVPRQANALGYVNLSRVLEDIDIAGIYNALPEEQKAWLPGITDELVNLLGETDLQESIIFADTSQVPDWRGILNPPEVSGTLDLSQMGGYGAAIIKGSFPEGEINEDIESVLNNYLTRKIYKDYHLFTGPAEIAAIAFLSDDVFAAGSADAIRDVIDVVEGDQPAIRETVMEAYSSVDGALLKMALVRHPEAPGESPSQAYTGGLGMLLSLINDMETVSLAIDKQGDSILVDALICFGTEESAEKANSLLSVASGFTGGGNLVTSVDNSCVDIDLEIAESVIEGVRNGLKQFLGQ